MKKNKERVKEKWQGLIDTVMRFPLSILLLVTAATSNAFAIEAQDNSIYSKLLITFIIGASLFIVLQMLYERYFTNPVFRIVFMAVAVVCSVMYYIMIYNKDWTVEISVRTAVILFILFIAMLWIPVVRSSYNFNDSFMAVFKSFFVALLYDGVLFLGIALILSATDLLIISIDGNAYLHSANIIFVFIAPTYFLSMLPVYPGIRELSAIKQEQESKEPDQSMQEETGDRKIPHSPGTIGSDPSVEKITRMITPAKFLISLISFVIIPVTAVFTIILLLYIIMNIRGAFWTGNLMEPMLVSYSITVLLVYILSSTLWHPFAVYFRKIFPKVLIPIVLFQTVSSCLKITTEGITYDRYYVILFGIFATIVGIVFCMVPTHRNGMIAPILIALALISIIPPVDAFTVSRANQTKRLEQALVRNQMLNENNIVPNKELSENDKSTIIKSVQYLDSMGDTRKISFLSGYLASSDFEKTFGFAQYDSQDNHYQSFYYGRDINDPIPIAGYDAMVQLNIYTQSPETGKHHFTVKDQEYSIWVDDTDQKNLYLILETASGQEILRYEFNQLYQGKESNNQDKQQLSTKEMTFTTENDQAVMTLVANSISFSSWQQGSDKSAELIVLIKIK